MADITFITGSTLGSAEYVAEDLAEISDETGLSAEVLHGPEYTEVTPQGIWLLVSSTHGAGEIPDNLLAFSETLAAEKPDLSEIRYGAIGLGNHEYDLFCGAIRTLDQQLAALGAKRIGDRLEIDVLVHDVPEDPATEWFRQWITLI